MAKWHCPTCDRPTTCSTVDSRPVEFQNGGCGVYRRKQCSICGYRFTTYEATSDTISVGEVTALRSVPPKDPYEAALWYIRKGYRLLDPGRAGGPGLETEAGDRADETEADGEVEVAEDDGEKNIDAGT